MSEPEPPSDEKFGTRIRRAIATVEAWEADRTLLAECRLMIPFEDLVPELLQPDDENTARKASPYAGDHDIHCSHNPDLLLLQRLAVFFQKDVMTWVTKPKCPNCETSDHMEHAETRDPSTTEEQEGGADRVEVYQCKQCQEQNAGNSRAEFPRYNSLRKLLETRRGRCGEYANLFGLYCRAAGFETRYVSDWTDHVWVECRIAGIGGDDEEWTMADSCEGIIQRPSMYEQGWGKQLNYIVGVTVDSVTDVTPRYTRSFHTEAFQHRRRDITSSEAAGVQIIAQINRTLRQGLPSKRVEELERRERIEQARLEHYKTLIVWTDAEKHGRGRISGSFEWKLARHEGGNNITNAEDKEKQNEADGDDVARALFVEQYYLLGSNNNDNNDEHIEIVVCPSGVEEHQMTIQVQGVDVRVRHHDFSAPEVSVVVLDEIHVGCILQCRSLPSWKHVANFVSSLPKGRIVVMAGRTKGGITVDLDENTQPTLALILGGFQRPQDDEDGIVFMGQVETHPDWTICKSYATVGTGMVLRLPVTAEVAAGAVKLRTERNTVPQTVVGRLPESVMPLATQLLATETQKRTAFLAFANNDPRSILGYTTKHGCPVYLLSEASIPFEETTTGWNTFHFLPKVLVPDNDEGIIMEDASNKKRAASPPKFDVPLEENMFTSLLGPNVVTKLNGTSVVPTVSALHNTRLVGLYFSAHWCPPCRHFTPMLIEAYQHLKEEIPSHGLEIVFVSSDRAANEFQSYYGTMPWCAVPFEEHRMVQQQISKQFGVLGIPALVILDSMSGQVVSSIQQARGEVAQACQRGDEGIEELFQQWLGRIATDSQELYNLLDVSCDETTEKDSSADTYQHRQDHPYLVRSSGLSGATAASSPRTQSPQDTSDRVKVLFTEFVANGDDPNAAAAKAITIVKEGKDLPPNPSFGKGHLNDGVSEPLGAKTKGGRHSSFVSLPKETKAAVLTTVLKYLENAAREPWNPKFRQFKLSNKVVDRVTRDPGSLEFIVSFGMKAIPTSDDFVIRIPLAADLERMKSAMNEALVAVS